MKFLKTKKSLFYISIIPGLILNILSMFVVVRNYNYSSGDPMYGVHMIFRGFPLPVNTFGFAGDIVMNSVKYTNPLVFIPFILNYVIWILLVWIILLVFRYFKLKKQ